MIKPIISVSIFLLASIAGEAMAINCSVSNGYSRVAGDGDVLKTTLQGKTACKLTGNDWEWQEYHHADGTLIDWKKGSDLVDGTSPVGTWSATDGNGAQVTYTYGAQSYTYEVWKTKLGLYDFCTGAIAKVRGASLLDGQDSCD